VADDSKSELLHQFEHQPNINVKLSFIRLTDAAKRVPLSEHIGRRPLSNVMDEKFNGKRNPYSKPDDFPQTFRVVEGD
jgi:hypothetical protein